MNPSCPVPSVKRAVARQTSADREAHTVFRSQRMHGRLHAIRFVTCLVGTTATCASPAQEGLGCIGILRGEQGLRSPPSVPTFPRRCVTGHYSEQRVRYGGSSSKLNSVCLGFRYLSCSARWSHSNSSLPTGTSICLAARSEEMVEPMPADDRIRVNMMNRKYNKANRCDQIPEAAQLGMTAITLRFSENHGLSEQWFPAGRYQA